MERKISSKRYLLAFILTLAVFSGGIIMGLFLENVRLNDSQEINHIEKDNLRSLQLQQNYIDSGIVKCNALNKILETNIAQLGEKVDILSDYEKRSVLNTDEFKAQLRDYFLTELQFLLTAQEIDQKCDRNNVKILYFYDENEDNTQGKILDYLKMKFEKEVLIFSFDSQFQEEPMINILLTSYGIKRFPAVVVEDQVFEGHTSVKRLMQEICAEFTKMERAIPEECQIFEEENVVREKLFKESS